MTTVFGKELRKFRVDHDITLYEMSKSVGLSISYISGIESGTIKVKESFITLLDHSYRLDVDEKNRLYKAYEDTISNVALNLCGTTKNQRNLVFSLRRELPNLDDESCEAIKDIIYGGKK